MLVGLALRLYDLSRQGMWLDELGEAVTARVPLSAFPDHIRTSAAASPLDYIGVRVVTAVLHSHGTAANRAWAVLAGTAAIGLTYLVGRRIFGQRSSGLAAAVLVTLSGFLVYYSQETRPPSLTVAVFLVNLLAFARLLEFGRLRDWLWFSLSLMLCLYTYYYLVFVFPVEVGAAIAPYVVRFIRQRHSRYERGALVSPLLPTNFRDRTLAS